MARTLGLAEERVLAAYDSFVNIEGRIDQAVLGEKTIHYMRTKQENPDTLQSALDAIAADKGRKVVLLGLCTIDDVIPHYSNTFYSYDCDFDGMLAGDVEKFICFEKTTCADMAASCWPAARRRRSRFFPPPTRRRFWPRSGAVRAIRCI